MNTTQIPGKIDPRGPLTNRVEREGRAGTAVFYLPENATFARSGYFMTKRNMDKALMAEREWMRAEGLGCDTWIWPGAVLSEGRDVFALIYLHAEGNVCCTGAGR